MNDHPSDGPTQPDGVTRCLACGTPRFQTVAECPYCEHRHSVKLPVQFRFGIGSLMLLTTLISVLLGIAVAAPGLGILLAIFSVPAYVRAWSNVARRQVRGTTVDMGDKLMAFVGSLGVVVVIAISVGVTLFGTCLVFFAMFAVADQLTRSAGEPLIVITLVFLAGVGLVSLIVPLGAGIIAARKFWPHQD